MNKAEFETFVNETLEQLSLLGVKVSDRNSVTEGISYLAIDGEIKGNKFCFYCDLIKHKRYFEVYRYFEAYKSGESPTYSDRCFPLLFSDFNPFVEEEEEALNQMKTIFLSFQVAVLMYFLLEKTGGAGTWKQDILEVVFYTDVTNFYAEPTGIDKVNTFLQNCKNLLQKQTTQEVLQQPKGFLTVSENLSIRYDDKVLIVSSGVNGFVVISKEEAIALANVIIQQFES